MKIKYILFLLTSLFIFSLTFSKANSQIIQRELISNTEQCLYNCELVFRVQLDMKMPINSINAISHKIIRGKGFTNLKNVNYYLRRNITYFITVNDYGKKETCKMILNNQTIQNKTICKNETVKTGEHQEKRWKYEWKEFKPQNFAGKFFEIDKWYYIKIIGKKQLKLGHNDVDIVPNMFNQDFTEMAWWNSSWNYYKNQTWTENSGFTLTNYSVETIFNHEGHANSECSDIRVVDSDDNEIDFGIANCNATHVNLTYRVNIPASSSVTYSIYYGNNTAINPANSTWETVRYAFYEDFEYTDSPTNHGWTDEGVTTFETVAVGDISGNRAMHFQNANSNHVYKALELINISYGLWNLTVNHFPINYGRHEVQPTIRQSSTDWSYGFIFREHNTPDIKSYTNINQWQDTGQNWDWDYWYKTIITVNYSALTGNALYNIWRNNTKIVTDFTQDVTGGSHDYWIRDDGTNGREFYEDLLILEQWSPNPPSVSTGSEESQDTIAPQYSNIISSPVSPATYSQNQTYQFNVTWIDETGFNIALIEHNFTGIFTNYTMNAGISNQYYYNYNNLSTGFYEWRSFGNDTSNNQNVTSQQNYTVNPTTTTTIVQQIDYCLLSFVQRNHITNDNDCISNKTLRHNLTYNVGGNLSYLYTYERCNWGCDNITQSCYPSPTMQNIYMISIVIAIVILLFIITRLF